MYIGRLQLKGFKSFGGSHDLPLAPGMTAIVGPNGSGKSNLLDALRWVLGDSHASKLRISRQGDLLFQGSASLAAAREAEISIQLREETRVCTVRRRVGPDGTTQALVDGVRKNLAELDETKRLWRLEGDRFAFIGQGEVAEVIQQRPSARRMLLETLFGIDLYRKRRTEASDRLEEAREEYERLKNFSAELAARRAEIAPEVERASRARKILDALEDERKLLYWIRRARTLQEISLSDDMLSSLASESEYRNFWWRAWRHAITLIEGRLAEISQARENQVRELEESKSSLDTLTRTGYSYGTALASAKKRLLQVVEERDALSCKLEKLRTDREKSQTETKKITTELECRRAELTEAEGKWRAFTEARDAERAERERRNAELGKIEAEAQQLRARLASLGGSMKAMKELAEGKEGAPDESARNIKKELDALEKKSEELLSEQDKAANAHRDVYAALQQVSADLQRGRREASRLSSQLAEITEQAQSEVYPRPVQHVISASKLGKLKAKPRVVIDTFTCPVELALAMESYLGGRQFWLLVEDMDEAGRCIDQLKSSSAGRATFLPLDRCKPRRADKSVKLPDDGIVGWVMDLIECELRWRSAIEHLAGDLLIVEDYSTGQKIVRSGFRGPVATLSGDVFQPAGSISGGKSEKSGKAIELKSALSRLESESAAARKRVDDLSIQFAKLEEAELAAQSRKNEISQEIRDLSAARSAIDARREAMQRERERAKSEREALLSALKLGGEEWMALKKRREDISVEVESAESGDDVKFVRAVEQLRSKIAVLEEKLSSGFVLGERMIAELRQHERQVASLNEEASACESTIIANKGSLSRMGKRYYEIFLRRSTLLAEMAEFGGRYEEIVRRREARVARTEAARAAAEGVSLRIAALEQSKSDLERDLQELIANWEEQYPYPGADELPNEDPDELRRGIREKEREVRAMGDVDMGVLSEDRSLRDRLAYLSEQLDDVHQSMLDLEKLIADADNQARAIFTEALTEIDSRFNALFQRLFGGGEAHLEMVEGDSLWDSGVDVVARPPGKHPQSIAQLSGGEQSLSAISLLFASLEVAKSPIAVLDEVDAALDEVNLRRFAELTKEAAKDRQIFVMTHRRVTMERADALYGVTLSEPGLSQVIGVRVEDWA